MHLQEIACTRSFGHAVTQLQELQEAVSKFASRAAEKLRKQSSHACQVQVFIRTSPFRVQDLQFSRSVVVPLRRPTDDSRDISQAALMGLTRIFAPGYSYAKAGVMLLSLQEASQIQHELQLEDEKTERRTAHSSHLMQMLDTVNKRYGRGSVHLASAGLCGDQRSWAMKQERRTPGYTTCWEEMPIARA